MRNVLSMLVGLAALCVLTVGLRAQEGKEVTLKGTITCAKCDLKQTEKCATVIVVKVKDKDVVYFLDPKGKNPHKMICTESKKGSVTGTVSEVDGKKIIKASKVEFAE